MTIDLWPMVERSFGNPKMMQNPRNSARMKTELAVKACRKPMPRATRSLTSHAGLGIVNGRFRGRQVELYQLPPHFFHRNPFCLMGLRMVLVGRLIEPRTSAPAKLLRAQSRDIDEKKPIRDRRSRLDRFV